MPIVVLRKSETVKMQQAKSFHELITLFIERDGRNPGQLDNKSTVLSRTLVGNPKQFRVPKPTIVRWLNGRVKKPRQTEQILMMACVLRLTPQETDQLLKSASKSRLNRLQSEARSDWQPLFKLLNQSATPIIDDRTLFQAPSKEKNFVGRQTLIQSIRGTLLGQTHACCLVGMGGVGKTTLAIQMAYQLKDNFPDGVLWARLDKTDPLLTLQSFATAYGVDVSQYSDVETRASRVRELLADKQALLILDNAEDDVTLRPLLPPDGQCAVIITSRHHDLATTDGFPRFEIKPFDASEHDETEAYFIRVLGAARVRQERQTLQAIADAVGHLPLALSIIAYQLRYEAGWSSAEYLTYLEQAQSKTAVLQRGDRNLQACFDLGFSTLAEPLQQFFIALTVFEGRYFNVEASAAIVDSSTFEAKKNLQILFNHSFIHVKDRDSFYLHPLLQAYGQEQRTSELSLHRMVLYFLQYGVEHHTDFPALDKQQENILVTLDTFPSELDVDAEDLFISAVNKLYPYLKARGLYDKTNNYLAHAHKLAVARQDTNAQIQLLTHQGQLSRLQGEYRLSGKRYEDALQLAQQTNAEAQIDLLLNRLGALAYRQGQLQLAQTYYDEALTLAQSRSDENRQATLFTNLGLLAFAKGEYDLATQHYKVGIQLARRLNDPERLLLGLQNEGVLLESIGDYAQAKTRFTEAMTLAETLDDPELKSRLLGNLGLIAFALGNINEAAATFRQGLALAEQIEHQQLICRQLANLGMVETSRGRVQQAEKRLQEALQLAQQFDFVADQCLILNHWGDCALRQDRLLNAKENYNAALSIAGTKQLRQHEAHALFGLAQIAALRGNVVEAQCLGEESRALLMEIGHKRASEVGWWLKDLPQDMNEA